MRYARTSLLVVLVLVAGAVANPSAAHARADVSVSFFYDALAPHGDWLVSADFGYVWQPRGVPTDWRPYMDGRWVYTNYGWTFASTDPWGWATYHYGRWYFDPRFGWLWVPGTEWAPAWVVFHEGGGWIGWAPLPPRVGLNVAIGGRVRIDPGAFCFVPQRDFLDRDLRTRVASRRENVSLVRSTVNVTRFGRSGRALVNRSLPVEHVERMTRRRVERRRIVDVVKSREAPRTRVEGRSMRLFRPVVSARATHPPRVRRETERRGHDEHGHGHGHHGAPHRH